MIKSCSNCKYGSLHYTPSYWEVPEEWEIECNYPNTSNFETDIYSINEGFQDSYEDEAKECEQYVEHDLFKPSQELQITLDRIQNLIDDPDEDEESNFLIPNDYAINTSHLLLKETFKICQKSFFKAWVMTEENRGIHLVWSKPETEKQIRLLVPSKEDLTTYLYYESKYSYNSEYNITPFKLSEYIKWIQTT